MRKHIYQLIVLDEYGGINVKITNKFPDWGYLRNLVGSLIEMVSVNLDYRFLIIVEEDCVISKKKNNRLASKLCGRQVFGPAVLLKADGEKIAAFTADECPHIINYLMFLPYMDGIIKVVIE